MVAFIAVVGLIIGTANMGFNQAKANPDADSFFESNSHVVNH